MQLIIRNKWVSLKGSSYVTDVNGKEVMKVRGKFWTLTYKKFIEDLDGNVRYIVRNKFENLLPTKHSLWIRMAKSSHELKEKYSPYMTIIL